MSEVSPALRAGIAAAQARKFEQARPLLEQATTESPGDAVGWFWLAIASSSAAAAIPCLRRVLEIDRSHEKARTALAKLLMAEASRMNAAGDRAAARAAVVEASQLTPEVHAVWLALAALATDSGERLAALRRAVAITPDDLQLRTRLRQALLVRATTRTTDRAEALTCFREAAAIDPADPRVWQAIAQLAPAPAEALDAVRRLLSLAPDHPNGKAALRHALVTDARALMESGSVEAAYERWREAITVCGGDIETSLGLAATTPNPEEAARTIEAAHKLYPTDERVLAAMARLRSSTIDPTTVAMPADAFARFEEPAETLDAIGEPADAVTPLDSPLEVFAPPSAAPAPRPPVAAPVTPPPPAVATPPAEAQPPVAASMSAPAEPAAPATAPARRTVMVVDDSPTIRKILGLTLERAGYTVVAEPDGESAIARLLQIVPNVILLDIAMPKLDGYEVCKRIKQDPRTANVPVVMLSGKGAYFDKVKGHMAGATEYLTKPFETPAVLAVVTSFCEQSAEVVHG